MRTLQQFALLLFVFIYSSIGYCETDNLETIQKETPSKESIKNDSSLSENTVAIENFRKYVGDYFLKEANVTLTIVTEKNKIYLVSKAQGLKNELTQKNQTSLYDTTVGVLLTQIQGDDNSLTFNQNGYTTTIKKIVTDQ